MPASRPVVSAGLQERFGIRIGRPVSASTAARRPARVVWHTRRLTTRPVSAVV